MDWIEKRREELKERKQQREATKKNRDVLKKSGLLERIEKKRDEAEKEGGYAFYLSPPQYFDAHHRFNRKGEEDYFTVYLGFTGLYFSLSIKEGGVFLEFADNHHSKSQKIDPQKVTDKEIHEWFGSIVAKATGAQ